MGSYSIVDIFAGPGGLAEGFSSVRGEGDERPFSVALSIEKERSAHATLRFRSFLRTFPSTLPDAYYAFLNGETAEPDWADIFPAQWAHAEAEAWRMELGIEDPEIRLNPRLDTIRETSSGKVILIGGPPCQAYSLAGRVRNRGKEGYIAGEDHRHFLYEEYIRIRDRLRPAAFVMENVKGMLSSSVDGENRIFDRVLDDLEGSDAEGPQYRLIALSARGGVVAATRPKATDFILRAEQHGIPQARHRVIVVGIRADLAARLEDADLEQLLPRTPVAATAGSVLEGMPRLRSGLSRGRDGHEAWLEVMLDAFDLVATLDTGLDDEAQVRFQMEAARQQQAFALAAPDLHRHADKGAAVGADCPAELSAWLIDPKLKRLANHESRGHMPSDLSRYLYASLFARVAGRSPKAVDYPPELAPAHDNWSSGNFVDRFRVQAADAPSTTVTSHISKDGHYFIHPDPVQCRSLSVREAARLQTFPDNYLFLGNRTEQYVQVGNAVPPLLARRIGEALLSLLAKCTAEDEEAGADLASDAEPSVDQPDDLRKVA